MNATYLPSYDFPQKKKLNKQINQFSFPAIMEREKARKEIVKAYFI